MSEPQGCGMGIHRRRDEREIFRWLLQRIRAVYYRRASAGKEKFRDGGVAVASRGFPP